MKSAYLLLPSLIVGIIALFVPLTKVKAQQPDWAKVHTVTMSAIESLYNLNFEEAEARANEVTKLAPQDPRGYFFRAMTYYYRVFYANISRLPKSELEADLQKFMGYSQQTITLCERFVAQNPQDSKALFYMGGLYGYRGLALGLYSSKTSDYLTAARDAQKGVEFLKQSLAIDPTNADAQMGLGLFNYLISQTPSAAQTIIKLAGLSGDRNEGLRQLEYAAANGIYARAEAHSWLARIYSSGFLFAGEGLYDRAERHFQSFLALYPGNTLIRILYGEMLSSDALRRTSDAIAQFRIAANGNEKKLQRLITVAHFHIGYAHQLMFNFNEATSCFQKALALHPDWTFIHYNIGLCAELQGNRIAAMQSYAKAKDNTNAAKRLAEPLSEKELQMLKCELAFDGSDDTKSLAFGGELLKRTDLASSERAKFLYICGRALVAKSDTKLAEGYFAQALSCKLDEESDLKPLLHYYLGLAQARNGKKADATGSLEQALGFKNYDNEGIVRRSIERELARLKRL